jgi:hypothetical protein
MGRLAVANATLWDMQRPLETLFRIRIYRIQHGQRWPFGKKLCFSAPAVVV